LTLTPTAVPDASPASHDAPTLRTALHVLSHDRQALSGWLSRFNDETRTVDIARQSYWHPNGFAKLVLQTDEDHKVRLHVWPAGSHRLGESNPHGHRWNFASTILCGDGLQDTHYAEADTGVTYEYHEYRGGNVAGAVTHVRTVHLTERGVHIRPKGELYVLDTTIVHTVRPLGDALIATLVVQGAPCLESTPVYGAPGVNVDEPGRTISPSEVRMLIGDVLNALD